MQNSVNRAAWLVSGLLLAANVATVRAQSHKKEDKDPEYSALVREGAHEFDAGNFLEARTLFEQAHARKPSARTLRGLGSCAYELKHYTQAIEELQAALDDPHNPLTQAQRAEVTTTLEKAKRFVGSLMLETDPADASVEIDGRAIEGRQERLDAGDHTLAVSAPGHHPNEQTITIRGGKTLDLEVQLAPLELSPAEAARAQGPEAPQPMQSAQPPADTSESVFEQWWFWTVVGVVVAGAAVGTVVALNNRGHETVGAYSGSTGVTLRAR